MNEPVNYQDPSGHFMDKLAKHLLSAAAKAIVSDRRSIVPGASGKRYARDALDAFVTTAFPGEERLPPTTPAQSRLGAHVAHKQYKTPFASKVSAVVANKESRNRPPISTHLQNAYIQNIEAVEHGMISSVTAHLNMRSEWIDYRGPKAAPTRMVARLLHLASAAISGVEEHSAIKLGAALIRA